MSSIKLEVKINRSTKNLLLKIARKKIRKRKKPRKRKT